MQKEQNAQLTISPSHTRDFSHELDGKIIKSNNTKTTTKQLEISSPTQMAGWMMALIVSAGAAFVTAKKKKED